MLIINILIIASFVASASDGIYSLGKGPTRNFW